VENREPVTLRDRGDEQVRNRQTVATLASELALNIDRSRERLLGHRRLVVGEPSALPNPVVLCANPGAVQDLEIDDGAGCRLARLDDARQSRTHGFVDLSGQAHSCDIPGQLTVIYLSRVELSSERMMCSLRGAISKVPTVGN